MAVTLENVVPWGRLLDEYRGMFALTEDDFTRTILDVGGGPASFNAEATAQGSHVISVDPIYRFSTVQIEQRVQDTYDVMLREVYRNLDLFVWDRFESPEDLGVTRLKAMRRFLADLPAGIAAGRYMDASLPDLPFKDSQFDLGLCANFLFLYSDKLSTEFHIAAVREMCRVATEVRIFPLHDLGNQFSAHVQPVTDALTKRGYHVEQVRVPYEFRHGSNKMLRIMRAE